MEDNPFVFSEKLTLRMLKLRFANDKLFKCKKQPWIDFRDILLKNGFPDEVTVSQIRKKWTNLLHSYQVAKKQGNPTSYKYYYLFDKHFGNLDVIDKYDSWPEAWRLKLAICVTEAKEDLSASQNDQNDQKELWRTVEKAMRMQDLPIHCCIQDIKGVWNKIKITFRMHYRWKKKKRSQRAMKRHRSWPLYDIMLEYIQRHEPENLCELNTDKLVCYKKRPRVVDDHGKMNDFQWSKDITESFIQLRLQNDHMFYGKKQPWPHFTSILRQEYGFPNSLGTRVAAKKWQQVNADYQRAKAMNNTSWQYFNIFELYLGEGSPSLNPLLDWEDKWVMKFIEARSQHADSFLQTKDPTVGWREVEKELRRNGIPIEYSLLELPLQWSYLDRTFKSKRKFATKGVLIEQWPFYEAMAKCMETIDQAKKTNKEQVKIKRIKNKKLEYYEADDNDNYNDGMADDDEDNIKLFDLKQKMEVEEKQSDVFEGKQCRACAELGGCVDVFQQPDEEGVDLATKLLIICGIEVEKTENLPTQICNVCLEELENAYKFRRKCQNVNIQFREYVKNIKTEILDQVDQNMEIDNDHDDMNEELGKIDNENVETESKEMKRSKPVQNKTVKPKKKYQIKKYYKICEICGVYSSNLKAHVDSHNTSKMYTCDECGKSFKARNNLMAHIVTHQPGYVPDITCEICGKKLKAKLHYKRHLAYHKNERKHACSTCGKGFNDASILKVHTLIHTDERPHACSECGKTFRTAGCVSRHKRIVHKIMRKVQ